MADSFAHLHVHTEYSMLDGASRLDDVISVAAADGQPALGITDHGNMYGVLDFYRGCHEAGIKPIIGTEAYMAHESRLERPARQGRVDDSGGDTAAGHKLYYHLTLLAENDAGYKNLIQLASRAFLEGYYYKPRCDWETLADHSTGIMATTGCLSGHVLQALLRGEEDLALQKAALLQEIFGRDNLFVEIQDHGIPDQRRSNAALLRIARKLGAPLLATNDSHYTHRHDAEAHDALLCVQTGSLLAEDDRLKFHGDEHYLKTSTEMRELFAETPKACDNSLWIAERADLTIEFGKPQLPDFPVPDGFENDRAYLRHLTMEGARQRWGDPIGDTAVERLAYELEVIASMGFDSYFLITWDLIRHARSCGIRVGPGRGSAAGCAVAYCLQITDLDPIRYDLLFERFLNPARVSMPDIDMDFDSRFRDEMIRYAAECYGRDHVAQIVTFSQIKARAAVRDASRVLGYPYSLGDRIAKAMPPLIMGRATPLRYCFEQHADHHEGYNSAGELREIVASDPDAARVVEVAKGLEGLRRQDGIHAAAVVITKDPLTEYLPIQRKPEQGKNILEAPVVTQYEMHGVEALGLLKMDILGLRNLDVISDCLELINQTRGISVDIDSVALDDEATFELLRSGNTVGVFQLESGPMRTLIRSLAPTCFDDVAALVALYRPGPMAANMHNDYANRKNGRQAIGYIHEDAAEILSDTYGLMIYQESVMRMAQKFAGYTLAEADSLRKAMGKKSRSAMDRERERFVAGVESRGYEHGLGVRLFEIIAQFADYAFNKSHSYGYGYIAYQIAYLKANYPVEYFSALLTSVRRKIDDVAVYLNECQAMDIKVTVPDINRSVSDFTPLPRLNGSAEDTEAAGPGEIVFGLSAIRNVGVGFVERVMAERSANGPYQSFVDFIARVDMEVINKGAIESLIKAGTFDSLDHPRKGLLQVHEQIIDNTLKLRREHELGVMSLFGDAAGNPNFDEGPEIPGIEFEKMTKLACEKEMLGLYISDHPLTGIEDMLRRHCDCALADIADAEDGKRLRIGGVITNLVRKWTRKGALMAVFQLEDLQSRVEVMVFPKAMQEHGPKLSDDAIVLVRGRVNSSDDAPSFYADDITLMEHPQSVPGKPTGPVRLRLRPEDQYSNRFAELRDILAAHPGEQPVEIHIGGGRVMRLPENCNVDSANGLYAELRVPFGRDSIIV